MRRTLFITACCIAVGLFIQGAALGVRHEPKKANKFQATLVTSYAECTSPNDTLGGGIPLPGCHPAVPADGHCYINAKGGGKVLAKEKNGDIAIKAKLKGIEGCDGETLCAEASLRATTDNCLSGDPDGCTSTNFANLPITYAGCCMVTKGKCQIKTTVDTEVPGAVMSGDNASIALLGCSLARTTGTAAGKVADCGLLVP
jgi:hypothetical protein